MFETIDRMCLRVGALLHEARALDPAGFAEWVTERMPFGLDKAKRLIAIHLAYSELPAETLANLPRPWQALYALREHVGRLDGAIESGEIGPTTTVREARERARQWGTKGPSISPGTARYSAADEAAGAMMAHHPDALSAEVFMAVSMWTAARAPDRT